MLINNRYQVIRTLGEGGFGHAYLAEDTQMPSGRRCVIKQLKPQATGTASSAVYQVVQDRFQREAAILEKIGEDHPQIPRLYAYFTENQKFYLVQEWIDGTTLEEILATQGPQSESKVRSLLGSLLPVLDFIHQQGLIHRDLKPDNIMLRLALPGSLPDSPSQNNTEGTLGQPVLIDFGAVRETMGTLMNSHNSLTSTIVIGTPGYMPSEQAAGRPLPSSDLYSLGLTAIYALTGRSPQDLASDPQTGEVIWRDLAGHVSPDLVEVIDKAVRSHPRDRYSSSAQMLSALSGHAETSAVGMSPQSTSLPVTLASPAPVTANQVNTPTYQQSEQGTQVVSPVASPVASSPTNNNTHSNRDDTVVVGGMPASNNNSNKRLSPVVMGLMAAAVGASAIGGGLLVSQSAGDSSLQAPPIKTASTERASTTTDSENANDSDPRNEGENAATETKARTTQISSTVQSTEGVRSAEIALSETRTSSSPAVQPGQPESAVTPDNPDELAFGYAVFFREDLRTDRVNVYARVDDRGEPLHYGLPGDRVTLLDQVNRSDAIWNLVRFESGAEGWVPQDVIAWDQAPPVEEAEETVTTVTPQPAYGWLTGIAPGNQVDIYPTPMFDPGPEHYGLVGDRVSILDSAKGYDDGLIWYRVVFDSGAAGWVRNDFIALP